MFPTVQPSNQDKNTKQQIKYKAMNNILINNTLYNIYLLLSIYYYVVGNGWKWLETYLIFGVSVGNERLLKRLTVGWLEMLLGLVGNGFQLKYDSFVIFKYLIYNEINKS